MTDALELPSGETVAPGDVFLYNGYPYRYRPVEDDEHEFVLAPLYWGGSGMDVPFASAAALADQWEPEASGVPDEAGWRAWLADARGDDRFADEELDAVERVVLDESPGPLARLRRALGL